MRKYVIAAVALLSAAQSFPRSADAQNPLKTPTRPTVSPYLDLANRNFSPAYAYFRRIRPEVELRQRDRQLAAQVTDLQNRPPLPHIPTTLEARYRNVGGFYGDRSGYYSYNRSRFNRSLFAPQ